MHAITNKFGEIYSYSSLVLYPSQASNISTYNIKISKLIYAEYGYGAHDAIDIL